MTKNYTNKFILNSLKMPVISDLQDLSDELAISKKTLYLMSKKSSLFYTSFTIKKKDKTNRKILSPSFALKIIQKWILTEILEKIYVFENAIAYKKGKGSNIKKNAEIHRYSIFLYEIDLKDFFTSISRQRIFYVFRNLGYNTLISNILTNLCTYEGYLPQGGVCSPYLSNIVCMSLDNRLNTLCSNRDIKYSRYADDLTFSCDNKHSILKIIALITEIVNSEGFVINKKKTRFLSPASHKSVTGITINDGRIKASKEYKRNIRSAINNMIWSCDYSDLDKVRGMISYVNSIEDDYKEKIRKYIASFYNKDITYSLEAVAKYNLNKIYSDLPDMEYQESPFK